MFDHRIGPGLNQIYNAQLPRCLKPCPTVQHFPRCEPGLAQKLLRILSIIHYRDRSRKFLHHLRSQNSQSILRWCRSVLERLHYGTSLACEILCLSGGKVDVGSFGVCNKCRLTLSHSSHARPAPKPNPTYAGHARRLKRRTEKTIPNDRPRPERMSIEERQRSHYVLKRC